MTSDLQQPALSESVFKPTFVLMCGRIVGFAATFLIPILLTRLFAPEQFGTYKQLFLIYTTVWGIAQLGMAESLFYFLPGDLRDGGRYVLNAVLILLVAGAGSLGLLVWQQNNVARLLNNADLIPYLMLLGGNLVFMIASAPLEVTLVSRKHYRWAAYAYGSDVVRVIFYLFPLIWWRDLRALLWGGLIFSLIRFVVMLGYLVREFAGQFRPSARLLWAQFAYTIPFELAVLLDTAQSNFHQYAVSHYFNAATFAIYTVGCIQLPLIGFVASPAGNVMMVLMAEQIRKGRETVAAVLWNDTTRKLALLFLPITALLIATARDMIPFLFTERYRASIPIFMVWMLTVLPSVLQTDSVLRVYAATRFLMVLNLIRLVLVAVFFYLLIGPFGLVGAVLATIISMVLSKIIALGYMAKLMRVEPWRILPWKQLGAISLTALLASAGPLAAHRLVGIPPFFILAASGVSYTLLYLFSLWAFGVLSAEEKAELASWLRRWQPSPAPKPAETLPGN